MQAQNSCRFVKIRTKDEVLTIVPVGIEKDYINNESYIFGFTKEKAEIVIQKYSRIKSVTMLEESLELFDEDYTAILDAVDNYFTMLYQGDEE